MKPQSNTALALTLAGALALMAAGCTLTATEDEALCPDGVWDYRLRDLGGDCPRAFVDTMIAEEYQIELFEGCGPFTRTEIGVADPCGVAMLIEGEATPTQPWLRGVMTIQLVSCDIACEHRFLLLPF